MRRTPVLFLAVLLAAVSLAHGQTVYERLVTVAPSNETATVYLGRSNVFTRYLHRQGSMVTDLSGITRMVFKLGTVEIDSASNASAFNWTTYEDADGNDIALFSFGSFDLPVGRQSGRLYVYDSGSPSIGWAWDTAIPVQVVDGEYESLSTPAAVASDIASHVATYHDMVTEEYTATAGQTVFNLVNTFILGSGTLRVYINGVHQASAAYTETDTDTITMSEGLDAGDIVVVILSDAIVSTVDSQLRTDLITTTSGYGADLVANVQKIYNVKDYGATSGGLAAANTTAIQAAIDAAELVEGTVFIPAGTYAVSALTVDDRIKIIGESRRTSVLHADGTGSSAVIDVAPSSADIVWIEKLWIDLTDEATATGIALSNQQRAMVRDIMVYKGAVGIQIDTSGTCYFETLRLTDQTTSGVVLNGDGGLEHYFNDVHVELTGAGVAGQIGFHVTRTTTSDVGGLYFKNLRIVRTGTATLTTGMKIDCAGGTATLPLFMSAGCVIDGIGTTSLWMINLAQSYIVGSWMTSTGGHAIVIDGGSDHYITNNNLTSINLLNSPAAVTVIGNRMGGTYAINVDSANPPTLMTVIGNRVVQTLTNDFDVLIDAGAQTQALPQEFLTNGGGGATETLVIRNADDANQFKVHLRTNASGDWTILDDDFNIGMNLKKTTHRLDVYGPVTVSGNTTGPGLYSYDGTPESALIAPEGSICMNVTPASTEYAIYIKRTGTGNTGWEGVGTVLP